MESDRIHARAVIMREAGNAGDAAGAEAGWLDWLAAHGVPAITGVDTRALVRHIREAGAMRGGIFAGATPEAQAREQVAAEPSMVGRDLARVVTLREPEVHAPPDGAPAGGPRIVALDTGIKRSIVRSFTARGATLELMPCTTPADELLARDPDGFFLVPGPGDPAALDYLVDTVRALVARKPVFGICLGHQLLSRAAGLETFKLPFGHRGANHPVKDVRTGRIAITSQNHGFAVRGEVGGAPGVRARRRRADPRQPLRRHGRGHPDARRPGRLRPVPPRGRARPARLAGPVRRLHRRDRARRRLMPRRDDLQRILVLGSGPIVIGQAAEFDYSGAQACKVLLQEGYEVILVNSNPATIMTDPEFATRTYVEPLLPGPVAQVIERERPDALLPTLGGQTALNLAKALLGGRHAGALRGRADRRELRRHRARRGPRALRRDDARGGPEDGPQHDRHQPRPGARRARRRSACR